MSEYFLAIVNPAAGGGRCGQLADAALKRLRGIDEMTPLAEPAATLTPVEIPVPVRHPARGDPVDHQLGPTFPGQCSLRGQHGGRPAGSQEVRGTGDEAARRTRGTSRPEQRRE